MPLVSEFYGIKVYMYSGDHNPPHLHAKYSGKEAVFTFDGEVDSGFLPKNQRHMMQAWIAIHLDEIYENWTMLQNKEGFKKIAPLK